MSLTVSTPLPHAETDHSAPPRDLSALLEAALGARWSLLHPEIKARFALPPGASRAVYLGVMARIERSPLGWLLARLLRHARVLPHQRAREVEFRFDVEPLATTFGWDKCRLYRFADEDFRFRSRMTFDADGVLRERFAGGLGMNLELAVAKDTLLFLDRGYFLHVGRWRLDLPRWLSPGRFRLVHRNLDAARFEVVIDIRHPLFGHLFHQRGEFVRN